MARLAAYFFGLVALMSVLYHVPVGWVHANLGALYAALFIFAPHLYQHWTGQDHVPAFGPAGRGLVWGVAASLVVLLPYALAYVWYFGFACSHSLPTFVFSCSRLHPFEWGVTPWRLLGLVLGHLIGVALPEEYFYRGFLMDALLRQWPGQGWRRAAWIVFIQAVAFALGHVLVDFNPVRLAVFFPALLFGLLRLWSGTLWAPMILHALSNVVAYVLEVSLWR